MSTQSGALGLAILDYARRAEYRHLELRLGRQQGRRVRQRSDSVLGGRPAHRQSSCSTSRASETRRSSREHCAPRQPDEADRGGQIRPIESGREGGFVTHRSAGRERHGRRCAVSSGRRHSHEHARRALRRRGTAVAPAAPRGRRVAIVTNAGGPGILAADACEGHGLELAPL